MKFVILFCLTSLILHTRVNTISLRDKVLSRNQTIHCCTYLASLQLKLDSILQKVRPLLSPESSIFQHRPNELRHKTMSPQQVHRTGMFQLFLEFSSVQLVKSSILPPPKMVRQSVLNKCLWDYLRPGCGIALIFCVSPLQLGVETYPIPTWGKRRPRSQRNIISGNIYGIQLP